MAFIPLRLQRNLLESFDRRILGSEYLLRFDRINI